MLQEKPGVESKSKIRFCRTIPCSLGGKRESGPDWQNVYPIWREWIKPKTRSRWFLLLKFMKARFWPSLARRWCWVSPDSEWITAIVIWLAWGGTVAGIPSQSKLLALHRWGWAPWGLCSHLLSSWNYQLLSWIANEHPRTASLTGMPLR